jgi:hypothetical protein
VALAVLFYLSNPFYITKRNKGIIMHTIRTHFGGLDVGDSFIYRYYVFKKVSAYHAVNGHTMRTTKFKLDQLVEVTPE